MNLKIQKYCGLAYIDKVTELMLSIRAKDKYAGLYEAADLQWWWSLDRFNNIDDPDRLLFWLDDEEKPLAVLVLYEGKNRWDHEFMYLPDINNIAKKRICWNVLEIINSFKTSKPIYTVVHEHDREWRSMLESNGWHYANQDMVQMEQKSTYIPEVPSLPEGMYFHDETQRNSKLYQHHLCKRGPEAIAERLKQCSLYRPDLDLAIKTNDALVAAYCVCWVDQQNNIGIFEPVRTEDKFQKRGLGSALLMEGIRRMNRLGATSIKISHEFENAAAKALYTKVGFQTKFLKIRLIRTI